MKTLAILTVASALAFAGAAYAANNDAATTNSSTNAQTSMDPTVDITGKAALGVDISKAGSNPADVQAYVATLSADQQTGVKSACENIVKEQNTVTPPVAEFCKNLVGTM